MITPQLAVLVIYGGLAWLFVRAWSLLKASEHRQPSPPARQEPKPCWLCDLLGEHCPDHQETSRGRLEGGS